MIQGKLVAFTVNYPSANSVKPIGNLKAITFMDGMPVTTLTITTIGSPDLSEFMNSEVVVMTQAELKEYTYWKLNRAITEE